MGFLDKLWTGVKDAVVGIPSSIIGTGLDLLSGSYTNEQNRKNSAWAFDQSYSTYKRRYQDTMEDMRLAGLNPILAAGSGGFNVSGQPSMATPQFPSVAGTGSALNLAKSMEAKSSSQKNRAQALNLLKDIRLKVAQIAKTRAEKGLITEQERLTVAKIGETYSIVGKIFHEVERIGTEIDINKKQKAILTQNLKMLNLQLKSLSKQMQWYKGAYGDFLGWLKSTTQAFGLNLGLITGVKMGGR